MSENAATSTGTLDSSEDLRELAGVAQGIRIDVLQMIYRARSSHIGSCFSIVELLTILYWRILNVAPSQPSWPGRDRFILSKGHACVALYAVLAQRGFFSRERLGLFYQDGSALAGHATDSVPGVDASTGSLGHGLSLACGMAIAGLRDSAGYRVFTLLSDGECQEGSVWEAMLFAGHHQLENLIAIVDCNGMQGLGRVENVISLVPMRQKWEACGWAVREIDGHNLVEIENTLCQVPFLRGSPSCVIAHTTKGKGVSFFENKLLWHYRAPNEREYLQALAELQAGE